MKNENTHRFGVLTTLVLIGELSDDEFEEALEKGRKFTPDEIESAKKKAEKIKSSSSNDTPLPPEFEKEIQGYLSVPTKDRIKQWKKEFEEERS